MTTGEKIPELRLVLITNNYNYIKDGAVFALNKLVQFLEQRDVPVMVVAAKGREVAFESYGTVTPVPSIPMPPPRSEYRITLGIPRSVQRKIKDFRPTLFHVATPDYVSMKGLSLARRWGVPSVASYHSRIETYMSYYNLGFLAPFMIRLFRWVYRDCVQLYAPSPGMADVLREQRMSNDVRLWTRGVDPKNFNPNRRSLEWRRSLGLADDDIVVTYVSRLVAEKNVKILQQVFESLPAGDSKIRTMIVGDGPEMRNLQASLPDSVFTGHLEEDALYRAYASSDVFFFPSTTETFGIVTLEAMASGLPAVCADSTGNDFLVRRGQTGFLLPQDETDGFVTSIRDLASNEEMRKAMGKAALERSALFTWDRAMSDLLDHYYDALRSAKKGGP